MKISDLQKSVTERIIKELKEGTPPWVRPWENKHPGIACVPMNAASQRMYTGINVLILWAAAIEKSYPTHGWLTFKQANDIGANVRKGEKCSHVVFVKRGEKEEDGEIKKTTIMKAYSVFNVAQLENLPNHYLEAPAPEEPEVVHDNALRLLRDCGAKVVHGGNKAAYYPVRDEIVMPPFGSFHSEADYWGTLNHELIHWTGHKDRLGRQFGKRFGDKAYAFEELVAELGSAFTCAQLSIPATFRSAGYIEHWLKVMEEDHRAIFTAASYASHASSYVFEQAQAVQEETPEVERQEGEELAA